MFYLEYLLKKYGQAKKKTEPEDSIVSVKFKPGKEPEEKPLQETIDVATGKPHRATYAPGGPKAKIPAEAKAVEKIKERIWDIPVEFWKKKLSENELSKVNDTIDKVAQREQPIQRVKSHLAEKAIANIRAGKAKPMNPLAAEGLRKDPMLRKEYLRAVGQPRPEERRFPEPAVQTPIQRSVEYWKKKLSEDGMSFVKSTIEKIAKKRYSAAAKERMGVRAPGTPQKVEETYEAIRESPKSRKWIREHPYKGRKPKASAAAIAWAGYKRSKKKANYDVPTILEKIGAEPDLVETAKELERLSEEVSRKTLLDFWQRLGRAAMSAKILATPEVRGEMMRERGLAGAAIGAPLGGLIGYAAKPGLTGALAGAAIGGVGAGTLGAYLAKRKSERAAQLLKDPAAQRALVGELARAMREKRPAELL